MNIELQVRELILEHFCVEKTDIHPTSRFVEDLGLDSLDVVELVMAVEDEFDIEIPDEDAEKTPTVQSLIDLIQKKTGRE